MISKIQDKIHPNNGLKFNFLHVVNLYSRFRRPQTRPRVTAAPAEVDSEESNEIAGGATVEAAAPATTTQRTRTRLFSPQSRTRFRPRPRPAAAATTAATAEGSDNVGSTTTGRINRITNHKMHDLQINCVL